MCKKRILPCLETYRCANILQQKDTTRIYTRTFSEELNNVPMRAFYELKLILYFLTKKETMYIVLNKSFLPTKEDLQPFTSVFKQPD